MKQNFHASAHWRRACNPEGARGRGKREQSREGGKARQIGVLTSLGTPSQENIASWHEPSPECFWEHPLWKQNKGMTFICKLVSISGSLVKVWSTGHWVSLACLLYYPILLGNHWLGKPELSWGSVRLGRHTGHAATPTQLAQRSRCLCPILVPEKAERIGDIRICGNGGSSWDVCHIWDCPAREERQVASAGEYVGMSRSGVAHKLRIICCIRNGGKDMEST